MASSRELWAFDNAATPTLGTTAIAFAQMSGGEGGAVKEGASLRLPTGSNEEQGQSIPHATWTKLNLTQEDFDDGGIGDPAAARIAVTKTKSYDVVGKTIIPLPSTTTEQFRFILRAYVNGVGRKGYEIHVNKSKAAYPANLFNVPVRMTRREKRPGGR